jgi:enoyl-CoA hydratase/carnithine racemase
MALNVESTDGICRITINRPEVGNRVDRTTCLGIVDAFRAAETDARVRVIVLTASGNKFCTGGQVDGASDGAAFAQIQFAEAFGSVHEAAVDLTKPLIAAVNGDAVAGGFSLVSSTDLAISVDTAKFGLPELGVGLFPMLALATSVHLLPRKVLFDLIYNCRLLSADEALHYGLISSVVPQERFEDAVMDQAHRLTRSSRIAIASGRRAYESMLDMPRSEAIRHGALALVQLLATEDGRSAARALALGETPVWKDR